MSREVVDLQLAGVDRRDYPDFCDAYIESAYWADTGEALTDEELEKFNDENGDLLNQMAHESLY